MIASDKVKDALPRQSVSLHFLDGFVAVVVVLLVIVIDAVAIGGITVGIPVIVQILEAGELNRNNVTHSRPPE